MEVNARARLVFEVVVRFGVRGALFFATSGGGAFVGSHEIRVALAVGTGGRERDLLFQCRALARGTSGGGRGGAEQVLKVVPTSQALVFVDGHPKQVYKRKRRCPLKGTAAFPD